MINKLIKLIKLASFWKMIGIIDKKPNYCKRGKKFWEVHINESTTVIIETGESYSVLPFWRLCAILGEEDGIINNYSLVFHRNQYDMILGIHGIADYKVSMCLNNKLYINFLKNNDELYTFTISVR